jgi:hypothetical protein
MDPKFKPRAVTPLKSSLVFHPTRPARNEEQIAVAAIFLDWCADVAHTSGLPSHVTMQHDLIEDMFTASVESGSRTFAMTHRDPFYVFRALTTQLFKHYEKLNAKINEDEQEKLSATRKTGSSRPRGKGAAGKRRS